MPGRQHGGNGRHGAPEHPQHIYSWVGNLGICCTVSCYAPTRAASRQEKYIFDGLNSILSSVQAGEKYIVLGDFNVCAGSGKL